jgi:murein DD-endopeptidase MepM/ murein hydrolase activator NlpD
LCHGLRLCFKFCCDQLIGSLFLKTAITISIRIPSSVARSTNLNHRFTTTVLDVQGKPVLELLKHSPRQHQQKISVMGLVMAVGASSFASIAFSSPAVVNQVLAPSTQSEALPATPKLPAPAQPAAETPVGITNIPPASQPLALAPLPVATAPTIPVVQPIATPANDNDFVYPLSTPTQVGSPFGWRVHPISGKKRLHSGMDFTAPEGTPVLAATGGKVISAGVMGGYGKTVVIEQAGKIQTRYAHLSHISVQAGQELAAGTFIGAVGSTGRSTGPHLHFEVLTFTPDGWIAIDPAPGVQYALNNLQQVLQASQSAASGG